MTARFSAGGRLSKVTDLYTWVTGLSPLWSVAVVVFGNYLVGRLSERKKAEKGEFVPREVPATSPYPLWPPGESGEPLEAGYVRKSFMLLYGGSALVCAGAASAATALLLLPVFYSVFVFPVPAVVFGVAMEFTGAILASWGRRRMQASRETRRAWNQYLLWIGTEGPLRRRKLVGLTMDDFESTEGKGRNEP